MWDHFVPRQSSPPQPHATHPKRVLGALKNVLGLLSSDQI